MYTNPDQLKCCAPILKSALNFPADSNKQKVILNYLKVQKMNVLPTNSVLGFILVDRFADQLFGFVARAAFRLTFFSGWAFCRWKHAVCQPNLEVRHYTWNGEIPTFYRFKMTPSLIITMLLSELTVPGSESCGTPTQTNWRPTSVPVSTQNHQLCFWRLWQQSQ